MGWILNQSDSGLPAAFRYACNDAADTVEALTRDTQDDVDERAWYRAALATKAILCDHSAAVRDEWSAAYAGLSPMWWPE